MDLNELFDNENIESVEARLDLERQLRELSARDAGIVYLWACGYTQAEIAAKYGLSQRHIGRILAKMSKKA